LQFPPSLRLKTDTRSSATPNPAKLWDERWWCGVQAKLLTCVSRVRDLAEFQRLVWYRNYWGREFGGDYLGSREGRVKYLTMPKSGSKQAREHLLQWFSPAYSTTGCGKRCNLNLTQLMPTALPHRPSGPLVDRDSAQWCVSLSLCTPSSQHSSL
jgi:hypothetical protein